MTGSVGQLDDEQASGSNFQALRTAETLSYNSRRTFCGHGHDHFLRFLLCPHSHGSSYAHCWFRRGIHEMLADRTQGIDYGFQEWPRI
jgi:hypothetical protein